MRNFSQKVSFIWGVADLLRGDYKPSEYGRIIMPLLLMPGRLTLIGRQVPTDGGPLDLLGAS